MAAATILDTVFRLPVMVDEANGAVSPCAQVHMSAAPTPGEITGAAMLMSMDKAATQSRSKTMGRNRKTTVLPLERHPCGHPLADLLWKSRFR